eukprot:TRINITY_DN65085_c0_g1_i1.p1 TRINITY_DN65085_c0_g1~~TRINITY_DN65085_c0_g1_i1.p1  ORF type:complete len:405 (-),score=85.24 TRINITY_DN65085_c0_g1_i1:185-1360(-)
MVARDDAATSGGAVQSAHAEAGESEPDAKRPRMAAREVQFGKHCRCTFGAAGSDALLQPLTDSKALLDKEDWAALRNALERDGYLYLREALPRHDVDAARQHVLDTFAEKGDILDARRPVSEGALRERCGFGCIPFLEGKNATTHSQQLLQVFEGERIRQIFRGVLDSESVISFDYKWLRGMPRESFTGAHMDSVYMSRGTPKLLTCWIPFGENPLEVGALAILEGSHRSPAYARLRETYGSMDHEAVGLDGSGWFSEDPQEVLKLFGGQWKTADFSPGDLLCFTMHTLHMSTSNVTDKVRISADVRWQSALEPVDPRYIGDVGKTLEQQSVAGAWNVKEDEVLENAKNAKDRVASVANKLKSKSAEVQKVTISELRKQWGFPVPEGVILK